MLADLAPQLRELQLEPRDLLYSVEVILQLLVPEPRDFEVAHQRHQQVHHEGVYLDFLLRGLQTLVGLGLLVLDVGSQLAEHALLAGIELGDLQLQILLLCLQIL